MRGFSLLFLLLGLLFADSVSELQSKLDNLNKKLEKNDSVWLQKYKNFEDYGKISLEIAKIQDNLKKLDGNSLEANTLKHSLQALQHQEKLLESYKTNPFKGLVEKPAITNVPNINNPLAIVTGLSYIKAMRAKLTTLQQHQKVLQQIIANINERLEILQELRALDSKKWETSLYQEKVKKIEFKSAQNLLNASLDAYVKDMEETTQNIKAQIKDQLFKLLYVLLIACASIVLAWVLKHLSHKYLYNDERAYTINKAINFINANVVVLIFLFAYLENVSYLVTMLGFVGAGFAIAMRDLFMSMLGWLTMILKGSVHVGDRIKVSKDGNTYVGDVLDISMLYITLFEDVTLTTYLKNNGRAGRIVFIPNNCIFNGLLTNYSHLGLKTVWDSLDFFLTFDSNHERAKEIATQIATECSKDYSQTTATQLAKMRTKYALRTIETAPKVFYMAEKEGMRLYVSYLTNAYATLTLRSTISTAIVQAFLKTHDVFLSPALKEAQEKQEQEVQEKQVQEVQEKQEKQEKQGD
ncbi:mechanosensitive ion channel domain-containing protein [Helicobacter ailurogastricus]|uniref:Putative mechanosensitive ion channel n=1 Tax=Helicobacter ailurogastricus TaxID=1578720 RepID=A0A0K2XDW0_9HELI|nr:mechanosensitive ion channel domain-containing protein [Helicobacter ailurogastricus]CRF40860.1 Putative mechanosensitive ion channel [Helicobacter ailurogastricus]CRF42899.1 Putative mechanosensitive ion channel [Helicobacter ailurogastricus]CRF43668.1 Putative mechanosensitive ion channel [Helicobacter ailurogastricus]GLH57325.1 Mechanosensitive ion channel membrane protein [Helicobacter ailurogastricus]GLH59528.1 Mechanosensitive ion channel membrane protein [Helicobacter ailurogastricus